MALVVPENHIRADWRDEAELLPPFAWEGAESGDTCTGNVGRPFITRIGDDAE